MASDKSSNTAVQRRVEHSEDDPLPREKLPESLQKIVDNEESLMEQIYDGTYVKYPFLAYLIAFTNCPAEQTSLQILTFDTQHMPVDSVQYCSVPIVMLHIPQT